MRRHRARRAGVVLALALLAAACGGGGDDAGGGGTGGGATGTGDEGTPTPGGKVVYGLEAETADGFCLPEAQLAVSGIMVARTIRDGVKFHDGTDLTAEVVKNNIDAYRGQYPPRAPQLFLLVLSDIDTVEVTDPSTVTVTLKRPWVDFDGYLYSSGRLGIMAQSQLDDTQSCADNLVGTGPFTFVDWVPNQSLTAEKNPDYWATDAEGNQLPYLDEIEFRPIPDALNRRDALLSGSIDLLHSDNGEVIQGFRDNSDYVQEEIDNNAEVGYTLLHVTQTLPDGTPSPLQDQRVRCGLAYAWDEPTVNATISQNVFPIANGPFAPETPGHLDDTGYPQQQDMDRAKELIAEYKAENPGPLNLSLATTQDETNLTVAQFQKQWWEEAGVDSVTLDQIDQGNYILTALLGNFQVFQWRNHSGFDLDNQYIWWHSASAVPVGELALNFGRIKDPQIDQLLDQNRSETDPAKKQEYAEEVNRIFAEQCYNLWGTWDIWGIAHKPTVHGVENFELPDGSTSQFGQGIAGTFYPMTLWVDQ
jgi:peptide/nickel transport system substrate-binding protein